MSWSRRDLIRLVGAGLLVSALPVVPACGPDPGPDYVYDGPAADRERFTHGVASGDPLTDSVILWTRVDLGDEETLEAYVEVFDDESLDRRVAAAYVDATAERWGCVKVDLDGLRPGRTYFYRFRCQDRMSPVGRTRTAPSGRTRSLRLGVVSCSNYSRGYFHAYAFLAARELDVIAHLGDYIYEYGTNDSHARQHEPTDEILTLEDYRQRYAQYRTDPHLQEAHRLHPWICTWDDHESANNAWQGGAQNHQDGEGAWSDRKAASSQAWFEWQPVREGAEGRVYRQLSWGDLADLMVLDTRIHGRDQQSTTVDIVNDEDRQLLGADQESWLLDALGTSEARWQLLLQQVVFGRWGPDGEIPFNNDAWDGYPATRRRILEAAEPLDGVVVLTGDVHSSWATEVSFDDEQPDPILVEAVTPGVTSEGIDVGPALDLLIENNPHIRYAQTTQRGCVTLDIDEDEAIARWWHFTDEQIAAEAPAEPTEARALRVRHGEHRWEELEG